MRNSVLLWDGAVLFNETPETLDELSNLRAPSSTLIQRSLLDLVQCGPPPPMQYYLLLFLAMGGVRIEQVTVQLLCAHVDKE